MVVHLPLLCWIALGCPARLALPACRPFCLPDQIAGSRHYRRLYLIFGVAFGGITIAMFEALNITLPDIIVR
jgi:hypothetical protein